MSSISLIVLAFPALAFVGAGLLARAMWQYDARERASVALADEPSGPEISNAMIVDADARDLENV